MFKYIKQIFCKHEWQHDHNKRNKGCAKCLKTEEVYMGWV